MGRAMVDPLYVLLAGERRLRFDMLPGRFALGVRPSRGLSVGGRGAGPGFMNCPVVYMLRKSVILLVCLMLEMFCACSRLDAEKESKIKGGLGPRIS